MRFLLTAAIIVGLGTGPAGAETAEAPDESIRPAARPAIGLVAIAQRAIDAASRTEADGMRPAPTPHVVTGGPRPRPRPTELTPQNVTLVSAATDRPAAAERNPGFDRWVANFRGRARAQGISQRTFDAAFANVRFLPDVIQRDRRQSEFTLSTGAYLGRVVSETRVANGREAAAEQAGRLQAIADRFGVESQIVAAIWGMESNYGSNRGDTPLISALSTLAYEGRRGTFFEAQLIAALKILQSGDTAPDRMTGSWAGAMGHTQFIPTSYEAYAVDFTGDGRRDIWSDDPSDALASTAAYLARSGWVTGMPWGVEVVLPRGFDFGQSADKRMPSDWARLGVMGTDGAPVPDHGSARLLLPSGAQGVAFLVFKNFDVIKRYNNSDAYALGVGHLGDRIAGAGPFKGTWPDGERGLKHAERSEMQTLLTRAGFDTGGVDGRIGPNTISAIRAWQASVGMAQDGHPSVAVLDRLRD